MSTQPPPESREDLPPPVNTERYESPYEVEQDDVFAIASLINVVGTELTSVDKLAAAGDGSIKATKIDQNKIFRGSVKPSVVQPTESVPGTSVPVSETNIQQPTQVESSIPTIPVPVSSTLYNTDSLDVIIKALDSVSIDIKDIQNCIKKIDSIDVKVKSLEKVYDKLLTKIVNGAKRVTITVNNDKN